MENLMTELNQERTKYKDLVQQYNQLVTEHNSTVDKLFGILQFMQLQCGILYTAITEDPVVDDPLAVIPGEALLTGGKAELSYLRTGWTTFLHTLAETQDASKAQAAYEKYISYGGK